MKNVLKCCNILITA